VMMYTRFQQKYTNILGSNVTATNPAANEWLGSLRQMFLSSGSGPGLADTRAYGAVFGMVQRQAAMRAFIDVLMIVGVVFLAMIPLVLIMKRPRAGAGPGPAAH